MKNDTPLEHAGILKFVLKDRHVYVSDSPIKMARVMNVA